MPGVPASEALEDEISNATKERTEMGKRLYVGNLSYGVTEAEQHHPDFLLHSYKLLDVKLSTHAIDGLSENDFILAAKLNDLRP